ncbi:MAG: GatB/YqeY domain-containing protein [Oscillospiraceae bacterium]
MEFKKLQQEMITAMKSKNKARKDVISGLIAAVKKVAIDNGVRDNIPDDMVDTVILKELKTAQEHFQLVPIQEKI